MRIIIIEPNCIAKNIKMWEKERINFHENAMKPEKIKSLIEAGLSESEAHVEGDGAHFTAIVICPTFEGKSRIQKQQMVYDTVKPQLLDGSLHALSVKAYTPAEWSRVD